ncbi:NAD-dependent protein deacetylase sirtuin-2-like [Tubulanus polymorphus]|uniref:NAD-dependent protein deacetylase sirtuin-2-like n=1 Tax=Tubulanus polymorphus TaxID=672921 RepID=UPI003DA5B5C3
MAEANKTPPEQEVPEDEDTDEKSDSIAAMLASLMQRHTLSGAEEEKSKPKQLLEEVTFKGVSKYIKDGCCKNIIVMTGAGISTSAGIPDFRSPGSGLYHNLEKYDLPNPQAIFDIGFFKENPEPFFMLAKNLWPGVFKPTPCHYFIRLLHEKGMLLRTFTQNIDTLERVAGIPGDEIVEAHGTFHTSHCLGCRKEYSQDWMKEQIFTGGVPKCTDCEGLVKPDIVFFGEALPNRFFECAKSDFEKCDLLIIMGSSLVVQPFASMVNRVPETTPRLYINLENNDSGGDPFMVMLGLSSGFQFEAEDNYRDVFWQGTCDDGVQALADLVAWGDELKKLVEEEHKKIDATSGSTTSLKKKSTVSPKKKQL